MHLKRSFLHVVPLVSLFIILLVSMIQIVVDARTLRQLIVQVILLLSVSLIFLTVYFLYLDQILKEQKLQMLFWSFVILGYIPSLFLAEFRYHFLTIFLMSALITSMIHVRLGFVVNFVMLILLSITKTVDLTFITMYAIGGSLICLTIPRASNRQKMVYIAIFNFFALGIIEALLLFSVDAPIESQHIFQIFITGINGFLVVILVYGTEPIWETLFKITSSARLIELCNSNEPLLQRMLLEAPGTYHHSMLVANLAEKASLDLKIDYTLARTGALYHDIGKLLNPEYFIENQHGFNIHDELSPDASAAYIKRHITDGIQLAKEYKLPDSIKDIIIQHQGDAIISYFYTKALEHSDGFEIDRTLFSYDGPKPLTKEAAIVMLADCVEAAVKSMAETEKNIESIKVMIRKVTHSIFTSGQLDDSPLMFKELKRIEAAFLKVYNGMFHERIKYEREI